MQLYALDFNHQLILAKQANRKRDYFCLECQQAVRIRGGIHRQTHFFHLKPIQKCTQHTKGMAHIQAQLRLLSMVREGDGTLEHRFPEINRIADFVWWSEKLVFEVQCSLISGIEVMERIQDYRSIGFEVVWILHDKNFNKWRLRAAELLLVSHTHYYTNINAEGKGEIYDLWFSIKKGCRNGISCSRDIDLSQPKRIDKIGSLPTLPAPLQLRCHNWTVSFEGDWLGHALQHPAELAMVTLVRETLFEKIKKLFHSAVQFYFTCFQLLLERSCR